MLWNDVETIKASIQQYQQQQEHVTQHITQLDRQRAEAVDAVKLLQGAIAALEQLLQNEKDSRSATVQPSDATPQG